MYKIKPIYASEIAKIADGTLFGKNTIIEYVSIDTREEYKLNTAYIAIKGKKYDGHTFISEALRKESSLIISNYRIQEAESNIVVTDTAVSLGRLAKYLSENVRKIGITGSVGKTTVKEMVYLVLNEKYNVAKTKENENNEIGVPITLLKSYDSDIVIVEMGMRGLNQIRYLSSVCEPEISIITNIGTAHLELLKTVDNIFKAKTEILEYTKKIAIIPYDKRLLSYNYREIKPRFIGYDVKFCNVNYTKNGIEFSIRFFDEIIEGFKIKSFNEGYISNALFAITVGKIYDVPNDLIVKAINSFKCQKLHGEQISINGITVILDCYNASYESVKASLFALKRYADLNNKTPYLLLGDMLEIGEKSSEYHYRIGELAKDLAIKNIFAIGKYARYTLDGFLGGEKFNSIAEFKEKIINNLSSNDVLLVKGSRKMKLEKIVEQMKESGNE